MVWGGERGMKKEEGSLGHSALIGCTDQNKACSAAQAGGALRMDQCVLRSSDWIQTRAPCKVPMAAAWVRSGGSEQG